MAIQRALTDIELLLLTTLDDTEDAPWMVTPEYQTRIAQLLLSILTLYKQRHGLRWHLFTDLKIVMPRPFTSRKLDLVPDLMMAEADDGMRDSWDVEEEGQVPSFVLEVVTKESRGRDLEDKPLLYEAMGVREYAIFAPRRRKGPRLLGYRRDAAQRWLRWSVDEQGVLWSETLGGLGLYEEEDRLGRWLRVRTPRGERLLSEGEELARVEAEVARMRRLLGLNADEAP